MIVKFSIRHNAFIGYMRVIVSLLAVLLLGGGIANAKDRKAVVEKEVTEIGQDIRDAIISQDTKRLLLYAKRGITCVDSSVPFKEIKRDLSNPHSQLFLRLFGSGGAKEYFQKATDQKMRVDFMEVDGKERLDSVCLRYMSSNYGGENWPEICLYFANGKWGISEWSFFDCV